MQKYRPSRRICRQLPTLNVREYCTNMRSTQRRRSAFYPLKCWSYLAFGGIFNNRVLRVQVPSATPPQKFNVFNGLVRIRHVQNSCNKSSMLIPPRMTIGQSEVEGRRVAAAQNILRNKICRASLRRAGLPLARNPLLSHRSSCMSRWEQSTVQSAGQPAANSLSHLKKRKLSLRVWINGVSRSEAETPVGIQ